MRAAPITPLGPGFSCFVVFDNAPEAAMFNPPTPEGVREQIDLAWMRLSKALETATKNHLWISVQRESASRWRVTVAGPAFEAMMANEWVANPDIDPRLTAEEKLQRHGQHAADWIASVLRGNGA